MWHVIMMQCTQTDLDGSRRGFIKLETKEVLQCDSTLAAVILLIYWALPSVYTSLVPGLRTSRTFVYRQAHIRLQITHFRL